MSEVPKKPQYAFVNVREEKKKWEFEGVQALLKLASKSAEPL